MRSRTGCLTCRNRKLKCDEARPTCGQCIKARRTCNQSSGITFRHQQNASMNGTAALSGSPDSLKTFYAYKNTFQDDHVWLHVPDRVTFVNVTDPYADADELECAPQSSYGDLGSPTGPNDWDNVQMQEAFPESAVTTHSNGLEALSAVASADSHSYLSLHSPERPPTYEPITRIPSAYSPNLQFNSTGAHSLALVPAHVGSTVDSSVSPPLDPNLEMSHLPRDLEIINLIQSEKQKMWVAESDRKVAFLLRHYAEALGHCMDLFDCGSYFSFHVPVKALSNPLLKFAACAYAAKQLGKVGGAKAVVGGVVSEQASMETWPDIEKTDWLLCGAKYYQRAISLLREVLEKQQILVADNDADGAAINTSDELLAAAAILCEYEAMDVSGAAWSRHLNGTKTLLDIAEIGMRPSDASQPDTQSTKNPKLFAGARRAIFWNFARQDFAAAFITECQTRLDVNNFQMWRAAGVDLDDQGCLLPSNDSLARFGNDNHSQEDMIANGLILLLSKLNNYITAAESLWTTPGGYVQRTEPTGQRSETHLGISQVTLLERWSLIKADLDTWFKNVPDIFTPCARISHPVFSEVWYSTPMVSSAMMNYHMARIILLINKPHESTARRTTVSGRLKSYQSITAEIRYHSQEICGIALSRPEGSVRIFAIQPLFISGQSLTDDSERKVVLDLLRNIEKDLGWATEFRVQQLLKDWEW